MTATPHNGKEEDFQLFMALLDGDRFEGTLPRRRARGRRLRPDAPDGQGEPAQVRRHAALPRAHRLHGPLQALRRRGRSSTRRSPTTCARSSTAPRRSQNDKRAGTVGFALTILQRRLASSPEAIYQSLRRRRERLESRLRELELLQRGGAGRAPSLAAVPVLDAEDVEDLEDAPDDEVEAAEEEILDQATAAAHDRRAEGRDRDARSGWRRWPLAVRRSGAGHQVARAGQPARRDLHARGHRRPRGRDRRALRRGRRSRKPMPSPRQKLVIFTEHRDTLNYLQSAISDAARPAGGGRRDPRRHGPRGAAKAQESFTHDPEVQVLVATDAAGEGINLQRAHLMVNYDLPWNPNRLEQRFGRIHRIGQTEVCHLWNLVAEETREGDVYRTLLEKLEQARQALGGQVFDVLGKLQFEGKPLRDLLIEAIRYGDQPEVRARLTTVVDARRRPRPAPGPARGARARPRRDGRQPRAAHPRGDGARRGPPPAAALHRVVLPRGLRAAGRHGQAARAAPLRGHPRAGAGAQPRPADRHRRAGAAALRAHRLREGRWSRRRASRWPPSSARAIRCSTPSSTSRSSATATCCKRGAVLVDERDPGTQPRVLFYLEHAIQDASLTPRGRAARHLASGCSTSSWTPTGSTRHLHYAPYLDYRPLAEGEPGVDAILARPECAWITRELEQKAQGYAIAHVVPEHLAEVRGRRARADRQDRGGRQGPADQGDHLLGPPRRAAQAPGAGRQAERPAQLAARRASAPTTCRRGCRSGWRS